jgi:hypothetical protein
MVQSANSRHFTPGLPSFILYCIALPDRSAARHGIVRKRQSRFLSTRIGSME